MELTILTTTYNRANCLRKLYESLQRQSCKDFIWLIVDDGSTDNSDEVINEFKREASFPIQYIEKTNGGKHTALNVGIKEVKTELSFIVDSDDVLKENAVEIVIKYHSKFKAVDGLCGYSFLRVFPDGKVNGKPFPKEEWIASLIEARINRGDANSDKAEVYYTRILKEFPFPEYPNEKFLGEDLVWIRIARKYEMVHINEKIYVGQYLEEGLTTNRREHNIKSPMGCMNRAKEYIYPDICLKYRIKGALQYIVYGKFANMKAKELIKKAPSKLLVGIMIVPGFILYIKWKIL